MHATPPTTGWDPDHLRQLVAPPARTIADRIATTVSQGARVALLVALGAVAWHMAGALWVLARRGDPLLRLDTTAAGLWLWGATLLAVELTVVMVRDVARLPWPGRRPTGLHVFLRAIGGFPVLALIGAFDGPRWLVLWLQTGTALTVFGWHVPAALRCWRTATAGLRSLLGLGLPSSPALLARTPGRLGRRIVHGRLTAGPGVVLEGEGVLARLDPSIDALHLDDQRGPLCVIAPVHVDDIGYRSAGLRLEPDGLPVWILAADRVEDRLRRFRRRLALAAALDSAHIATATFGLMALGVLVVALALR